LGRLSPRFWEAGDAMRDVRSFLFVLELAWGQHFERRILGALIAMWVQLGLGNVGWVDARAAGGLQSIASKKGVRAGRPLAGAPKKRALLPGFIQ
jgi:hypothetical protein